MPWPFDDPDIAYDEGLPYDAPVPESPQGIEAWVTTPAGVYIAHLDRSVESPFREFWFGPVRNQPGSGRLEYHPDNQILADHPTLFDPDNLVHMRFRDYEWVWIIEDEEAALDEQEHATEWRKVSGPGTLQLLGHRIVLPSDFDDSTADGLNPKTWASQWRTFTNRAVGEMLWDLISETNPLVVSQITRGTVETTGADGWTQDMRFENILEDVVKPVTDAHGDVEMDGLTFNYYNALGTDKSSTIIFEEGRDVVRLRHENSERPRIDYVVGEGVGEGVFAKLAIAARSIVHRMGFYAAKEATNLPLLEVLTDSALAEHSAHELVSVEVNESRFKAFTDYRVGDTVRVIVPSQDLDRSARVEQITVAEDGDQVRVQVEIAGLPADTDTQIAEDARRTRSELGVRNRQPQGQLVPFPIAGSGVCDSANSCVVDFRVPSRMYVLTETEVQLSFSEFWAPATAASSGGGSTSGASSASSSGASTASSSDSGGSSTPTSGASSESTSGFENGMSTDFTAHTHSGSVPSELVVTNVDLNHDHGIAHTHTVTIGNHTHGIAHTHGIEHDHTTPAHTHGLTYTVYKETYPGSHSVTMAVYKRVGASWTLIVTISGLTDDIEDVDLSAYVDVPGSWRLAIQSAAAQPNNGRLAVNVSGSAIGAIKSA